MALPSPSSSDSLDLHRDKFAENEQKDTLLENSSRQDRKWEIISPIETDVKNKPNIMQGYMAKRRKWPMKGWHSRYFCLDDGFLIYGKNEAEVLKGKIIGKISIESAVISSKTEALRIEINEEQYIHHLKADNSTEYSSWLCSMQQHQQYQISLSRKEICSLQKSIVDEHIPSSSPQDYCTSVNNNTLKKYPAKLNQLDVTPKSVFEQFLELDKHLMDDLLRLQGNVIDIELFVQKFDEDMNLSKQISKTKGPKSKPWKLLTLGRKHQSTIPGKFSTSSPSSGADPCNAWNDANNNNNSIQNAMIPNIEVPFSNVSSKTDNLSPETYSLKGDSTPLNSETWKEGDSTSPTSIKTLPPSRSTNNTPSPLQKNHRYGSSDISGKLNSSSCSNLGMLGAYANQSDATSSGISCSELNDLIGLSTTMHSNLTNLIREHTEEKEKFKASLSTKVMSESKDTPIYVSSATPTNKYATLGSVASKTINPFNSQQYQQTLLLVSALRKNLATLLDQNNSLRSIIQKINIESDLKNIPSLPTESESLLKCPIGSIPSEYATLRQPTLNFSVCSSGYSNSDFFDAREYASDLDRDSDVGSSEEDETTVQSTIPKTTKASIIQNLSKENVGISDTESSALCLKNDSDSKCHQVNENTNVDTENESGNLSHSSINSGSVHTMCDSSTSVPLGKGSFFASHTGRRVKLPAVQCSNTGVSLMNLLCKNIGKDLSKISMPVTLNEPLSVLQRLCEELEYSELLDRATTTTNRVERMALVAAFAVSAYSSIANPLRASHKPFNPMLGETYDCVREDKGFRYIAEQVSHHPPITACHAKSETGNWTWWQDFRVKTKFWGKSMEFQPEGAIYLQLMVPDNQSKQSELLEDEDPKSEEKSLLTKEIYTWNKVTTCIHNLFGVGELWADVYGESNIKCYQYKRKQVILLESSQNNSSSSVNPSEAEESAIQLTEENKPMMNCKLDFLSASSGSYWSMSRKQPHEVQGTIYDEKGKHIQHLFGKCTEAIYSGRVLSARCIWRLGALPEDASLNYGFSRFAIELNEILDHEKDLLPHTDTRFRPDQRSLEKGLIQDAENLKLKLEQSQRERRKREEESGATQKTHQPMWFKKIQNSSHSKKNPNSISWVFDGRYWDIRDQNRGFSNCIDNGSITPTGYTSPKLW